MHPDPSFRSSVAALPFLERNDAFYSKLYSDLSYGCFQSLSVITTLARQGVSAVVNKSRPTHADIIEGVDMTDDYSIHPNSDGIKTSAPWRIQSYGDEGILTEPDLKELETEFEISTKVLSQLSRELGYCLDEGSAVNLVEVNRKQAIERAQSDLDAAAKLTKRAELGIQKAVEKLGPLSDQFAKSKEDRDALKAAQAHAIAALDAATGLREIVSLLISRPGAAARMDPKDKRKASDGRRQVVVETCCYAWADAGRTVSYTSATWKEDQRSGPLVDFIQSVVEKVTEPSSRLSVETLRKDIDRFKRMLEQPDPLSMPPTFGD